MKRVKMGFLQFKKGRRLPSASILIGTITFLFCFSVMTGFAEEKIVLRVWSGMERVADDETKAFNKMIEHFETEHPNVQIKHNAIADGESYRTAIRVAIGGGNPPDMWFAYPGEYSNVYARAGALKDLTNIVKERGWEEKILSAGLQLFIYRGELIGIPLCVNVKFFAYNGSIYDKYGLKVPNTWNELINVCEKLKSQGIIPIAFGNKPSWPSTHYMTTLNQRIIGEEQVRKDYNPASGEFSDPGYVEALKRLKFLNDNYMNPGASGFSNDEASALFYASRAAMFYSGTWNIALFSGPEMPKEFRESWDMSPFPAIPEGKGNQSFVTAGPTGFVVSSQTKHPEQALSFLKLIAIDDGEIWVKDAQLLSTAKGAVNEKTASRRLLEAAAMLEKAEGFTNWLDLDCEASVVGAYLSGLEGLIAGTMTPEQVMVGVRKQARTVKEKMTR